MYVVSRKLVIIFNFMVYIFVLHLINKKNKQLYCSISEDKVKAYFQNTFVKVRLYFNNSNLIYLLLNICKSVRLHIFLLLSHTFNYFKMIVHFFNSYNE